MPMNKIIAALLLFVVACGTEQQEAEYSELESELTTAQKNTIMSRASKTVGYSYWWGGARFGVSNTSDFGSCMGSCPSCSHNGRYGADCSGMVAKVWEVPSNNKFTGTNSHPYSTADFYNSEILWKRIERKSIDKADALVYRSGSSGHIVVYESVDQWGHYNVYECKGCAEGCVKSNRPISSAYRAIRKK
jgi:cell wall-associated NlpC family hydrolase